MLPFDESWNRSSGRVGPLVLSLSSVDSSIAGRVLDSEGDPLRGWVVECLEPTNLSHVSPTISRESRGGARTVSAESDSEGRL